MGATRPAAGWIEAEEAAERLGVRVRTLYTYASRGLVRTIRGRDGRRRRYAAEDVDELARRAAAAAGHAAAAASALDWGAPVLASGITSIDVDGPNYRGVPAGWLAERDTPFEAVATLLWTGNLPAEPPRFDAGTLGLDPGAVEALVREGTPFGMGLGIVVAGLAALEPGEGVVPWGRFVRRVAAWTALLLGPRTSWRGRADEAIAATSVADALAAALGAPPGAARWLGRALIVCADHELNASTFAARVAASTGASPLAAVGAALATWTGPRHGGASDVLEAHLAGAPLPSGVGFGHRLYPEGDPRGTLLLADARAVAPPGPRFAAIDALARRREPTDHPPNLDAGLVALAAALDLPLGAAGAVFAVGRTAGWIAHAAEQRASPHLLRPRARYVGP